MSFPLGGTALPTQVAGEDHIPPKAEAEYVAGSDAIKLISSTAAPGEIPNESSPWKTKYNLKDVPTNEDGTIADACV